MKVILTAWLTMALAAASHGAFYFTNFVGVPGGTGNADGTGPAARFNYPNGIAADSQGNIYVADTQNHTIRRVTLAGVVITIAGSSGQSGNVDGQGSSARFYAPTGIAVDASGNLYVADYGNSTIRKLTVSGTTWAVQTLAGQAGVIGHANGSGTQATFSDPTGIAVDGLGNIYVGDTGNVCVRKISPNGMVSTIISNGVTGNITNGFVTNSVLDSVRGVAVDAVGNIYVADTQAGQIKEFSPGGLSIAVTGGVNDATAVAVDSAGNVYAAESTAGEIYISGGGLSSKTGFSNPLGVAVDPAGNVYVADTGAQMIEMIPADGQAIVALAGSSPDSGYNDGIGTNALLAHPEGLAIDTASNVYVGDTVNQRIRVVTPFGLATDLAGTSSPGFMNGAGNDAVFNGPAGVAVDTNGNVYVADENNGRIQKISTIGKVTTVALGLDAPDGVAVDDEGNLYVTQASDQVEMISPLGLKTTLPFPASTMAGVAVDGSGNVYAADNNGIWKAPPGGTAVLVTNTASGVAFNSPTGVALDGSGNIYVADKNNNRIVQITAAGISADIAGTNNASGHANGTNGSATFNSPAGVAVDSSGNVYVADEGNNVIRKISPSAGGIWTVTTFAGGGVSGTAAGSSNGVGTNALFSSPYYIAIDGANNLYVSDDNYQIVRKITPAAVVTTIAGSVGTNAAVAKFNSPAGVAVDAAGDVYVADEGNNQIREISPGGVVSTLAGSPTLQIGSADGPAALASFYSPASVAVDSARNVYVTDTDNHTIRKIAGGVVSTLAGSAGYNGSVDGVGSAARFWAPSGIAADTASNVSLYVADTFNNTIRLITNGVVITIAGRAGSAGSADGSGTSALFNHPTGVAVYSQSNADIVYVADSFNQTIRMLTHTNGSWAVKTVAGTPGVIGGGVVLGYNGVGSGAQFDYPTGIAVDPMGNVSVADTGNNRVTLDLIVPDILPGSGSTTGGSPVPPTPPIVLSLPSTTPESGLILLTNGAGAIHHGVWPKVLENGKTYTVTAEPKPGYVFSGWVAGTSATENYSQLDAPASYSFTMESGLVLEANFVESLFTSAKGVYNGLFSAGAEETSGMLKSLTIGETGTYSGAILLNGESHSIHGSFESNGQATIQIPHTGLTVSMTIASPQVTGIVSNEGSWAAPLTADLASNGPAANYTMLILPDSNAAPGSEPPGDGAAALSDRGTAVNITGALADGASFSQSAPVSYAGTIPVYANLAGGKGLLFGWLNLDATIGSTLTWFHPRQTGLFTNGFIGTNSIALSPWTNPPAASVLTNLTSLSFAGTNFTVKTTVAGKVEGTSVNGSISLKNGLFKVTDGKTSGYGAILLNAGSGGGYYLTRTNAGSVSLAP